MAPTRIEMMQLPQLSKRLGLSKPIQETLERVVTDPAHKITFTSPLGVLNHVGITVSDPKGVTAPIAGIVRLNDETNHGVAIAARTMRLSNEFLRECFGQLKTEGSTLA